MTITATSTHVHHGVVIVDRGAAIVTVEHTSASLRDPADLLVTDIERLPFDLSVVAARVSDLASDLIVIDGEGLGLALWAALGLSQGQRGWSLYDKRGIERQGLVDELVLAIHEGRFHFEAGLQQQGAMTKAMASYHRQVKDDGQIGGELILALMHAIARPRYGYGPPRIY